MLFPSSSSFGGLPAYTTDLYLLVSLFFSPRLRACRMPRLVEESSLEVHFGQVFCCYMERLRIQCSFAMSNAHCGSFELPAIGWHSTP